MHGFDLHTHSNISDGQLSPEDLVQLAKQHGVHTLALTDHDSIDGVSRASLVAKQQQINLISGVEISTQWHRPSTKKTYGVHIVALNMQNDEPMQELLHKQQQIRAERAKNICIKLQHVTGYDAWDDVLIMTDGVADRITRNHIARALIQRGLVNKMQTAFDLYLKQGKKAFVPLEWVSFTETMTTIQHSGGLAVLAHPCEYDLSATNLRYLIDLFAEHGGHAVELTHQEKPLSMRQMVDKCIEKHQLKISVGSDFHGEHVPHRKIGRVPTMSKQQVGVWELFK